MALGDAQLAARSCRRLLACGQSVSLQAGMRLQPDLAPPQPAARQQRTATTGLPRAAVETAPTGPASLHLFPLGLIGCAAALVAVALHDGADGRLTRCGAAPTGHGLVGRAATTAADGLALLLTHHRSEERRVGKEC